MRWLVLLVLAGCLDPIDPRWSLDHDHVIAARATPPRVRQGEEVSVDALVAHVGAPPTVEEPLTAELMNGTETAVDLMMTFPGDHRVKKTVYIGEPGENPAVPPILVDGVAIGDAITIPRGKDVFLEVDTDLRVNWLTNVGNLFQDDVARAYINAPDAKQGDLVLVVRDNAGGVAWRVVPLRAE